MHNFCKSFLSSTFFVLTLDVIRGEKPKRAPPPSRALERAELNKLFGKGLDEVDEKLAHRIQGVGFAP